MRHKFIARSNAEYDAASLHKASGATHAAEIAMAGQSGTRGFSAAGG
jgi:hypothetical protein